MADLRHVYVCRHCTRDMVCVVAAALVPGDEPLRCPYDYDECAWVELDPALAHAVSIVITNEQAKRMLKGAI